MRASWGQVKALADKFEESIQYIDSTEEDKYILWVQNGNFHLSCVIKKVDNPDITSEQYDFEQNYKDIQTNQPLQKKIHGGFTLNSTTNMPAGYSVYPSGVSDNISTGAFGEGNSLILNSTIKTKRFFLLNNWYGIGGKASWNKHSSNTDYIDGKLIAPATVGVNGTGFNFTKQSTPYGFSFFEPVTPGSGNWDLNLSETKFPGKEFLHVTPVPVAGNTGHFDFNKETGLVEINSSQQGGYNLYDVDLTLTSFGRNMWGIDGGGETPFVVNNVIGKLLYANWCVEVSLTIDNEVSRTPNLPIAAVSIFSGSRVNT